MKNKNAINILSLLFLILSIIIFFAKILLSGKIILCISFLVLFLLINPYILYIKNKLLVMLIIMVLLVESMFTFYFSYNNYKIKTNPILFNKVDNGTEYTFNNYKSTFYIKSDTTMENFEGKSFVFWKDYLKGIHSVSISGKIQNIGNFSFSRAYNLNNVDAPDTIEVIGGWAFSNCENLSRFNSDKKGSIVLPKNTTTICCSAFYNCDKIESVWIGDKVTSIEEFAFDDCDNLKTIYYSSTKEKWDQISKINFPNIKIEFNS